MSSKGAYLKQDMAEVLQGSLMDQVVGVRLTIAMLHVVAHCGWDWVCACSWCCCWQFLCVFLQEAEISLTLLV